MGGWMSLSTIVMIAAVVMAAFGFKTQDGKPLIGWLLSLITGGGTTPVPGPGGDLLQRLLEALKKLEHATPLEPGTILTAEDPTADDFLFEAGKALVDEGRHDEAKIVFDVLTRRKSQTATIVSGDPVH